MAGQEGLEPLSPRIWSPMLYQLELLACTSYSSVSQLRGTLRKIGNPLLGFFCAVYVPYKTGNIFLIPSLCGIVRLFLVVV